MSISLEALGIDQMSIEDRLELVHAIWDSIAASNEQLHVSEEFKAELDRRWTDYISHPETSVSWEEVKAETLARLKK